MKWLLMIVSAPALLATSACTKKVSAAHACSPPRSHWQQPTNTNGIDVPTVNVAVDRQSRIYVDGTRVSLVELGKQLRALPRDEAPTTRVFLETEMGADCDVIDRVRDAFDSSLNCRQAMRCNEGIQGLWWRWPVPAGTPPS